MENDSIRSSGGATLVDIWIEGKLREVAISDEAIGAYVGFERARSMTDEARCEFVRTNLSLLIRAAKARLKDNPLSDSIRVDAGHLPRSDGRSGERRAIERRKSERRKADVPRGDKPERRRGDRRSGERRRAPKRSDS
jgi:hypothetical protein